MELRFWAATDTGRVRDHNEDNFLVDKRLQLFVVCDGMGGHAAGEVASAICVRTVRDVIAEQAELLQRLRGNPDDEADRKSLQDLMGRAVQMACARIFEMAQQDSSRRGMGTTCTALVLITDRGYIGHVGDSRVYRLRDNKVGQVTNDHSLLNEMIRQGKIPADTTEADFPHNNAVTRAVGVREHVEVDTMEFTVAPGDRLVMCSDGFSEYLPGNDQRELMGGAEPEETTQICIDHANASGGKDNITIIVIDCVEQAEESSEDVTQVIEILRQTAYFHYLAPPELQHIRKMASRIELDAEEMVVGEDEANDRLFIILKGSVSLQLDGRQVSVLTTGENFGEMALIDAQDEQDTNLVAQTLEPTVMLSIARDQFIGLLRTDPGLAIKLLWNFVQVFADRLQSVPPEYRFTPDEWRREPEAAGDITPPSGSLVFKEDLRRIEEKASKSSEQVAEVSSPRLRTITSVGSDSGSDELARQKTVDLGILEPGTFDAPPPQSGSKSNMGAPDASPPVPPPLKKGAWDREEGSEDAEEPVRRGLTSGTYDSRLLAGGVSGKMKIDEHSGYASFGEESGDPDVTLSPWDNETPSDSSDSLSTKQLYGGESSSQPPPTPSQAPRAGNPDNSESEQDLDTTVGLDADIEQLRAMRKQTPETLKDKLRARKKRRPVPGAEVLKKAGSMNPTEDSKPTAGNGLFAVTQELAALQATGPSEEETENLEGLNNRTTKPHDLHEAEKAGGVAKRTGLSGKSNVQAPGDESTESDQPKVMISPDLMADFDDD